MSEEFSEPKKTVKRVTVKSPRKTAAEKELATEKAREAREQESEERREDVREVRAESREESQERQSNSDANEEIQPATLSMDDLDERDGEGTEAGKRTNKRRRKKKKPNEFVANGENSRGENVRGEEKMEAPRALEASGSGQGSRYKSSDVNKMAWKIFLAEVSEEGLALIPDHHAREISRRSFRLAEIFLDEQMRRGR